MTSLGETVAALARRRVLQPHPAGPGLMQDVADFGPNPGDLRMRVHVPSALPAKSALVVVLHGCTQTAEGYADGAGWLTLADRHGFVVLAPEQIRANNPNLCFNWFQPGDVGRGGGEVQSIYSMIQYAAAQYRIDPKRVFVTGLSAGGAMANAMLAAYPETFAAGAIVAGLPYGAASNVQEAFGAMRRSRSRSSAELGDAVRAASHYAGPWPQVSIWQGGSDTTVVPEVADELVRQWSDVHGVRAPGVEHRTSRSEHRHTSWRSPAGETVVELHRIAGMGHGTPLGCTIAEGCGTAGPFLLDVGVSSSLEIARAWRLTDTRRKAQPGDRVRASASSGPAKPASMAEDLNAAMRATLPPEVGKVITDALRTAGLLK